MEATATAPARQRKPRPKPPRAVRLVTEPTEDESGVLVLTVGKLMTPYFVDRIPEAYGLAFCLSKFDGTSYDVNLGDADNHATCECLGHHRWHGSANSAGRSCKHLDGLRALVAQGKL